MHIRTQPSTRIKSLRSMPVLLPYLLIAACCFGPLSQGFTHAFVPSKIHPQHPHRGRQQSTCTYSDRTASSTTTTIYLATDTDVTSTKTVVEVGKEIGKGSYGRVHFCSLEGKEWIGKRSLTLEEVDPEAKDPKDKVKRCQYYWKVEEHCYEKLGEHPQLPSVKGSFQDEQGRPWILFDIIKSISENDDTSKPAPCLTDLMKLDHDRHHDSEQEGQHHLYYLQKALGLEESLSLGQVLDAFLEQLLSILSFVHSKNIVHRDIKPGNLLISNNIYLIDFGSAADLDPSPGGIFKKTRVGMEGGNQVVAISPIYAAPELFIDVKDKPTNFDVFSAALIYCQLLFNFLDEKTDAGFHQQLASCDWDLDVWLEQELASKVRPRGLDEALEVLAQRPGLWRLLKEMYRPKPWDRISSEDALKRFQDILAGKDVQEDGAFFQSVLETFELCDVLYEEVSRPLHFLASFKRNTPLGLVLAEKGSDDDGEEEDIDADSRRKWLEATQEALPGQVFVKGIVEGGQADDLGIFEIGDQLQGVGEIPVAERGFEKVVSLIGNQPASSKYVTLHFDRRKKLRIDAVPPSQVSSVENPIVPQDTGAWSAKGRRKTQEDRFALHEVQDTTGRSVLVAGVFDGHGGTAASILASNEMPDLVSEALFRNKGAPIDKILESAWTTISENYQSKCSGDADDGCIATYDPREGTLDANTGADDLVAGTTASVAALDESNGKISIMNCGDSRTLLVNMKGEVVFKTMDHTPERERERLVAGKEEGLDYSVPKCSASRWYLSIGDYQYAVGRSLEGPYATSKGIVSEPDITTVQAQPGLAIISATDGLWEVMDSEEVAHVIAAIRKRGTSAGDAAKTLCSMAIEKGSSDNVSAVVVYLQ